MTVAVMVKVFDGLVLAADSASTLALDNGGAQVYGHANKVFHLHRHLPVAAVTWGLGNIGNASISTIAKDLRRRLMGRDPAFLDWEVDEKTFTVKALVDRVIEMFHDELYAPQFATAPAPWPSLGLLVTGYSAGAKQPEAWKLVFENPLARPDAFLEAGPDTSGWAAYAQPEATNRLFNGYDPALGERLEAELEPDQWLVARQVLAEFQRQPAIAPMPFGDAIELARFLVDVTVGYSRYLLGPDTVGGPVEVAGLNRHEGFKWIARKHYYSVDRNPEEPRHAY